jgi:hypothetical protein
MSEKDKNEKQQLIYHENTSKKDYVLKTLLSVFMYCLVISFSLSFTKLFEVLFLHEDVKRKDKVKHLLFYIFFIVVIIIAVCFFLSVEINIV